MDDDEDDVFQPSILIWNTNFREIKYEDRGTQTPSPALGQDDNMLPCGVAHEPRRLFYGRGRWDSRVSRVYLSKFEK